MHEGWQKVWYQLVAEDLLTKYEELQENYEALLRGHVENNNLWRSKYEKQISITKEWTNEARRLKQENDALKSDPMAAVIDKNRHNAAQQRIRELEKEVQHLRQVIKKNIRF